MSLLPVNEPKEADKTPTNFFIWGASMSGKTYLARQFPNPLLLNTDGNAKKVDTPSIDIIDFKHFLNIIDELKNTKHGYQSIIIDLVDDIETMMTNYICELNETETIGEAGYGKGYAQQRDIWKKSMMAITQMNFNIIFISHIAEKSENNTTSIVPSLPQKFLNMCMGRCDLGIKTTKMGNRYIRAVTERREAYTEDLIKDSVTLEILKDVLGVFDKVATSSNTLTAQPTTGRTKLPVNTSTEESKPIVTRTPPRRVNLDKKQDVTIPKEATKEVTKEDIKEENKITEKVKEDESETLDLNMFAEIPVSDNLIERL